jgi:Rrf2 family transcriptional regulator, nitric oxide-sensitive transcriptional repressor
MQLTRHTDYALRLLIHLAHADTQRVQVGEVAHLGFIETTRGRGGGLQLARPASEINLADVICSTEPGTTLVQCGGCGLLRGGCRLPSIFGEAFAAFREVLARYSLAELMRQPESLAAIFPPR